MASRAASQPHRRSSGIRSLMRLASLAATVSLFGGVPEAVSASLILTSDDRTTTFNNGTSTTTFTPSSPFGACCTDTFAGRQTSTVSTDLMTASGSGGTFPGDPTESGTSTFSIDFRVQSEMQIILTGTLDFTEGVFFPLGRAEVELIDLATNQRVFSHTSPGDFDFDGILGLGDYRLRAFAAGDFEPEVSEAGYTLSATFIPEPSTALLVALGLLGLARTRTRRAA